MTKFNFKLDRSALLNVSIYSISFTLRSVMWAVAGSLTVLESWMTILEYVAAFVIEISLYFFVFEMQSVRVLLESQTPQENWDQ